jgi:hypothetical protein
VGDYSWVIGVFFGGALAFAVLMMVCDWQRIPIKQGLRNTAVGLAVTAGVAFIIHSLKLPHADWLAAPAFSIIITFFIAPKERQNWSNQFAILAFTMAVVLGEDLIEALRIERYRWPIAIAAYAVITFGAWSFRKIKDSMGEFPPRIENA